MQELKLANPESKEKVKKALFQLNLMEVLQLGLDLNHIYLLEKFERGESIEIIPKTAGWIQGLVRKGYLLEDYKVTVAGAHILEKLRGGELSIAKAMEVMKPKVDLSDFEEWWKTYPPTDTFVYKEKVFKGSRSIRVKKDECKVKFFKILHKGKYTAKELIAALQMEIDQKKEQSFIQKDNKLKYMKNSLTYLNGGDYEGFVETAKLLKNKPESTNSASSTFSI